MNERGSGSEQYPPAMMLCLLIYSYATGVFDSRRIEHTTFDSVPVRVLCGDTHPDHDTICAFRRHNRELVAHGFAPVLELAARSGVLKVGDITVAIDGTKVLAAASKHAAVSYGRAGEQLQQVEVEIAQLMAKADAEDNRPLQDGLTVQDELTRRHARKAELTQARADMEARAFARAQAERDAAGDTPSEPPPPPPIRAQSADQLHRSGQPDHESRLRRALRTSLQRASGRGSEHPFDRRPTRQPGAQRQGTTRPDSGHRHRRRFWR